MDTPHLSLQIAVSLFKKGDASNALTIAKAELQRAPDNGKLWELCGMAHHSLGDTVASLHAFETATMLVPLSAPAQCVLAKCYAVSGQKELARNIFQHLLTLDGFPDNLLPVVAAGLGALGKPSLALEACRRAAASGVDDGQPLYGMAHYMERLGYPLEMITSTLRRAIDFEPGCFQYRYALATACRLPSCFSLSCFPVFGQVSF